GVCFSITDPTGQTMYQNPFYGIPDGAPSSTPPPALSNPDIVIDTSVVSPPVLSTTFNLPVDARGKVIQGTYTINAIYTQYLLVSPYTSTDYTVQSVQQMVLGDICLHIEP